ncbi:hypothetical protein EVAR_91565_1 [Eumeta japonica]|uniref:Uncharacterized protein n=1 Tax=Eumeta variegata TaxID=151549 RepID=A0A4C1XAS2_EUMVA|nr:hypothetical protein EVAR_91565_1 [Eumeta japonica]
MIQRLGLKFRRESRYQSRLCSVTFVSRHVTLPHPHSAATVTARHGVDVIYGCVRPLSLFYSDASADAVEERLLVPRSRSHARLRRNTAMSHDFSYLLWNDHTYTLDPDPGPARDANPEPMLN